MSVSMARTSFLRQLENFNHDIYAAYSEKNATEVRLVLDHLRAFGLKVYDPALERVPGKRIFYKWLENGIHKSKITLLFWSKEFKQDEICLYQSENAVLRTSLTKGRHIVISVVIDNCKIPKLYQQFVCVYAWLWRENPPKALENVLQAVIAHLNRARRPQCLGQKAAYLVKKRSGALPCQHGSQKSQNGAFRALDVFLNFRQIQNVLQNCVLCCQNDGCIYRCPGVNIKQFNTHVNACKFARVRCMNIRCKQMILRGQSMKHKKKCRFKKIKCENENCGKEFSPNEFKKHKELCPHRTQCCPNHKFGCKDVFEFKDTEIHLENCDYVMVECDLCKNKIIRMDLAGHKEQRCPHGPAECPHCNKVYKRMKLESHTTQCQVEVSCDNGGCGARMVQGLLQKHKLNCPWESFRCSYTGCTYTAPKSRLLEHSQTCDYRQQRCDVCGSNVAVKDISWHKKFCDQMVECGECGLTLPVSTKATHDKWMCPKQAMRAFCRDCCTTFDHCNIDEHRNVYHPVSLPDRTEECVISPPLVPKEGGVFVRSENSFMPSFEDRSPSIPTNLQDSGNYSLSTSLPSRSGTPLHRFEMGALQEAINKIPESSHEIETHKVPDVRPKTHVRGRMEEHMAHSDTNIAHSDTNMAHSDTNQSELSWKRFVGSLPKITVGSRNTLKAIDELFYSGNNNKPLMQNKFAPERRKELSTRPLYHRW